MTVLRQFNPIKEIIMIPHTRISQYATISVSMGLGDRGYDVGYV